MSNYYNRNNRRKRRSSREKIGFYTAFSICLIAVCMAVYSTYNTISNPTAGNTMQTSSTKSQQVNQPVTGVKVTVPEPTIGVPEQEEMTVPTVISDTEEPTVIQTTEPKLSNSNDDALETMLSVDLSLASPVKSGNITRQYSKDSVYFKTINVWKPHTGADFEGELGDNVYAMTTGEVTKVYDDKMYGKTVEISVNDVVCIYSGLGSANVDKGDKVETGDKIGVVGTVPFEASDKNHIHVAVKINGKYADPLSFIGNNE